MSSLKQNNKVLTNLSGGIINDAASAYNKIFQLDIDLQSPNRIFKNGSNQVTQITDKVQNKPIIVVGTNYVIYNYNGYYECSTAKYTCNDDTITTGHTLYFHINSSDHSGTAGEGVLYKKGNLIIRQKTNANNLEIEINSSVVIDYAYTHSTELFFAIYFDGTNIYLSENGVIKAKASYTGLNTTGTTELFGTGTSYFKGNVYSITRWDSDYFEINGTVISDVVRYIQQDFIYYQRCKDDGNTTLCLSSKHLKGAVINSSDEITSIKDGLGTQIVCPTGNVQLTNKGFYTNSSRFLLNESNDIGLNDYFYGIWLKIGTYTGGDALIIYGRLYMYLGYSGGNVRVRHLAYLDPSGTQEFNTGYFDLIGKYAYLSICRKNGIGYTTINGIVQATQAFNHDIISYPNTQIMAQQTDWYFDDVLISFTDSIIDPTGKSVGERAFKPPRRGSFDSEIIQF